MSDWYYGRQPDYARPDPGPWTYYGPPDPDGPECPECGSSLLDVWGDDFEGGWRCEACGAEHEWTA